MSEQEVIVRPAQESCVVGHNGRLYPAADTPLSKCPCNFDPESNLGKYLILAAGNPGDVEFDKHGIAEVTATHWLVFPEERPDPETGEVGTFARTVLFTAEGDTFRTSASHAPHRIAAALDLFPPEKWAQGVTFVIRERKGKRGFTYHDIRLHRKYLKG